jgi:hypothetical protein
VCFSRARAALGAGVGDLGPVGQHAPRV